MLNCFDIENNCFINELFNRIFMNFDILTLELIKGKEIITSTKKSHYSVIIDDSPSVVEHYLKENQEGIVYLPIRNYNSYLVNKHQERICCIL